MNSLLSDLLKLADYTEPGGLDVVDQSIRSANLAMDKGDLPTAQQMLEKAQQSMKASPTGVLGDDQPAAVRQELVSAFYEARNRFEDLQDAQRFV